MKIARKLPKVHGEMTVRIKIKKRCHGHEKPEGSKKAWKRFRRVLMALAGSEKGL